jgi:lycopene elongase/hydratase (dihydrobisanhydrobacterioruberin-forming)
MSDLAFLFRVSRPRFWFYLFGPYIVGLAAGATSAADMVSAATIVGGMYFLLPANALIYGVNDLFDYETDRLNAKKDHYEVLVSRDKHKKLALTIAALNLPFLVLLLILAPGAWLSLAGFLFFGIFYSAPPIRAKAIPFLDSAFNILYVFPGAFAYQMLSGQFPPLSLMIAAGCWTAAMHAYSAIPDIQADKEAGVNTIATVCGAYATLAICAVLYVTSAVLSFDHLGLVSVSCGLAYLVLMLASVRSYKTGRLFKLYKAFPLINVTAGFLIFWQIALDHLV